jgi:hypothetical protein
MGAYQLVTPITGSEPIDAAGEYGGRVLQLVPKSPPASSGDKWLTADIRHRVAEEAATRFLAQHPDGIPRERLVAEAVRRVSGWIERHGREPDDEGHVRRLMKTALIDYHRRISGSRRRHHGALKAKEETA